MASDLTPKVANVQFDVDGDILLLLSSDEGNIRFQVSSSALCLASPVFSAMVGVKGKFKESKSLQEKKGGEPPLEITLSDDNPKALAVILRIIHHQHDSVPKSLAEENLWEIAILVDKYDLREATLPWTCLWAKPYLKLDGSPLASCTYFTGDKGIFLAYAFGNEVLFRSISKNIILTWKFNWFAHCLMSPSGNSTDLFKFVPQPIVGIYILLSFHWFWLTQL